jgi:hypothetical protein
MIEVFKTNVTKPCEAAMLVDRIHKTFVNYTANFDLEDCDKILRVKCTIGWIQADQLIDLLKDFGFEAEVLPDERADDVPMLYRMFARAQSLSAS